MKKQMTICLMVLLCSISIKAQMKQQIFREAGKVNANGIQLAYEMFGKQGEAILLINGTGSQLIDWPVELCEELAQKDYRVIRFDNRDVGLSSKFDSMGSPDWAAIIPKIKTCDMSALQYTISDMAKDAVCLLKALNIEKAHIVGMSMGGAIAQAVAIDFPQRTLSLTSIAASSGNPDLPPGNPEVLAVMATPLPVTGNSEQQSLYLFKIYKAMGSKRYPEADSLLMKMAQKSVERSWYPAGAARHAAAIIITDNCDRRDKLKLIDKPVVVIHGADDPVVNVAAGREVAEAVKGSKLIVIPGMGHTIPRVLISEIVKGILIAARNSSY
jgi:pimeloyl-ACP methyl ester carboxylesterase